MSKTRRWAAMGAGGLLGLLLMWAVGAGAGGVDAHATAASHQANSATRPGPQQSEPVQWADQAWKQAQPPQGVSFSVLPTSTTQGTLEAVVVSGGSWFRLRHPTHMAVLIRHPLGNLLLDTGLGRQSEQQFAQNTWLHRQLFAYGKVDPVADQLARAGWSVYQVDTIIPSHMHWDHVSGLPDFPNATVWVPKAERDHAEQGHPPAFIRSQFEHVKRWRDLNFTGGPYMGYAQSQDVYGDGSVVLVPLSGHTMGQVGLFLNLPSGKHYFFTGDVTWTLEGLQWAADRSWLLHQIVHVDADEAANVACIQHIHQLMQRHPDLKVVPAHDENVLQTLPHFPAFEG